MTYLAHLTYNLYKFVLFSLINSLFSYIYFRTNDYVYVTTTTMIISSIIPIISYEILYLLSTNGYTIFDKNLTIENKKLHNIINRRKSNIVLKTIIIIIIQYQIIYFVIKYILNIFYMDQILYITNLFINTNKLTNYGLYDIVKTYMSVLFLTISYDIYFYIIHRLLHTKYFYFIHKKHHVPLNVTVIDNNLIDPKEVLIDYVFGNLMFYYLIKPNIITAWVHLCVTIFIGYCAHSNYSFSVINLFHFVPWSSIDIDKSHSLHHKYSNCYYGAYTTLFDKLFGTTRLEEQQE